MDSKKLFKRFAGNKQQFSVIIKHRKQNAIYNVIYNSDGYSRKTLSVKNLIGYTSPYTHEFFIGKLIDFNDNGQIVFVAPISRRLGSEYLLLDTHKVNICNIKCKFRFNKYES